MLVVGFLHLATVCSIDLVVLVPPHYGADVHQVRVEEHRFSFVNQHISIINRKFLYVKIC